MSDDIEPEIPVTHPFSVADASGRVVRSGRVPFESWIPRQASADGEQAVAGAVDGDTHWINAGSVEARPMNPAALQGETLTSLPVPCTIYIDGTAYACTDDTAELSFPYAGTFALQVKAWPYLDAAFEVTV